MTDFSLALRDISAIRRENWHKRFVMRYPSAIDMRIPAWLSDRFEFASGLDLGLLGILVAGIGLYIGNLTEVGTQVPHLIRFSDYASPDHLPGLATMPQDSALLLMLDEGSRNSQVAAGVEQAIVVPEMATPLVIGLGLVIAVMGPAWYWLGKPAFFRTVSRPDEP